MNILYIDIQKEEMVTLQYHFVAIAAMKNGNEEPQHCDHRVVCKMIRNPVRWSCLLSYPVEQMLLHNLYRRITYDESYTFVYHLNHVHV